MAAFKGHDEIAIEGHNIKLGRGGIREIDSSCRPSSSSPEGAIPNCAAGRRWRRLKDLAEGGWISRDATRDLSEAYCFLRAVEIGCKWSRMSRPTRCPPSATRSTALRAFLGRMGAMPSRARCSTPAQGAAALRAAVRDAPAAEPRAARWPFPAEKDAVETLDKLAAMGFRRPVEASQAVRRWLGRNWRALSSRSS